MCRVAPFVYKLTGNPLYWVLQRDQLTCYVCGNPNCSHIKISTKIMKSKLSPGGNPCHCWCLQSLPQNKVYKASFVHKYSYLPPFISFCTVVWSSSSKFSVTTKRMTSMSPERYVYYEILNG